MEKRTVRARLTALREHFDDWYTNFRRTRFPECLWIYVGISLALNHFFGIDPAFVFFLSALSVEASLATAYLARDAKRAEDKLDSQIDSIKLMLRNQATLTEAILEATRERP